MRCPTARKSFLRVMSAVALGALLIPACDTGDAWKQIGVSLSQKGRPVLLWVLCDGEQLNSVSLVERRGEWAYPYDDDPFDPLRWEIRRVDPADRTSRFTVGVTPDGWATVATLADDLDSYKDLVLRVDSTGIGEAIELRPDELVPGRVRDFMDDEMARAEFIERGSENCPSGRRP